MGILDSIGQYFPMNEQKKAAMAYGFNPQDYALVNRAMQNQGIANPNAAMPQMAQNAPMPQKPKDNTQETISALANNNPFKADSLFRPGMQAAQSTGDSYNGWNALADILGAYAQAQMQK